MNTSPLVSICALSYNHQDYIKFAIESFWKQEYKNIEILALDDGSCDKSAQILKELSKVSPCPMQVVAQDNCGCIGKNFNTLLKMAKGKYVMFIALDDALLPQAISNKVEIIEKDSSVQIVVNSQIQTIDENNNYTDSIPKMLLDNIENPTVEDILELDRDQIHSYFIQGCLYKKELVDAVGGFDDDMIADDLILRTKTAKYLLNYPDKKIVTLHKKDCLYRRHSSNISDNYPRQIESVAQYLDRYYPDLKKSNFLRYVYRQILKKRQFKEFFRLLKIKRMRRYIPLIPRWFGSLLLNDISNFFSLKK